MKIFLTQIPLCSSMFPVLEICPSIQQVLKSGVAASLPVCSCLCGSDENEDPKCGGFVMVLNYYLIVELGWLV